MKKLGGGTPNVTPNQKSVYSDFNDKSYCKCFTLP